MRSTACALALALYAGAVGAAVVESTEGDLVQARLAPGEQAFVGGKGKLCTVTTVGDEELEVCQAAFTVTAVRGGRASLRITRGDPATIDDSFFARFDTPLVIVRSNVSGDTLSIDGQPAGATPRALWNPGIYRVRVEKTGYLAWERDVTVDAGDQAREVWARLEPVEPVAAPEPIEPAPTAVETPPARRVEPEEPAGDPMSLVAEGMQAMEEEDYEAAIAAFEALQVLRPGDDFVIQLLAQARQRLEARESGVEEAVELAYLRLELENARRLGDADAIESVARRILELEPGDPEATRLAYARRGQAALEAAAAAERGDGAEVRRIWREYRGRWPDDEVAAGLETDHLLRAIEIDRDMVVASSARSASKGDRDTIEALWDEYGARWPDDSATEAMRQQALAEAREVDRGEAVEKARSLADDGEVEKVEEVWAAFRAEWPEGEEAEIAATTERAMARRKQQRRQGLDWVRVPPGRFQLGCTRNDSECDDGERYVRLTRIDEPYLLAKYETTRHHYARCQADGHCPAPLVPQSATGDDGDLPVQFVSVTDAAAFCEWLGGRLPSEAEWEYGAREIFVRVKRKQRRMYVNLSAMPLANIDGNDGEIYSARYPRAAEQPSDASTISHRYANYRAKHGADRWLLVAPVGQFPPNSRGLLDMAGNVEEWVADRYAAHSLAPELRTGDLFVVKGGHYNSQPRDLRVSARVARKGDTRKQGLGFRCAADVEEGEPGASG